MRQVVDFVKEQAKVKAIPKEEDVASVY